MAPAQHGNHAIFTQMLILALASLLVLDLWFLTQAVHAQAVSQSMHLVSLLRSCPVYASKSLARLGMRQLVNGEGESWDPGRHKGLRVKRPMTLNSMCGTSLRGNRHALAAEC